MTDLTTGRVALASPPDKNLFASAIEAERRQTKLAEEKAAEYRKLLGAVYSYCASDIAAYGGKELDRSVRTALGMPFESDL